jgi:hypothetical protein
MKHTGGCHCGKVRYEVEMEIGKVINCNCTICSKKGNLLSFVPATAFKLLSGESELSDYQFNKHIVHHLFCRNCGIGSFAKGKGPDGTEMRAINVRCLDGVDLEKLDLMPYDGRSK